MCYFCGRTYHSRSNCPAKNAVCYKCNKKGHFSVVCKTKINNNASACLYNSNLCAIRPAPDCLASATIVAYIKGVEVSTLIDTGGSSSFINETTAKRLKLKVFPHHENVLNNIAGRCVADLSINGVNYNFVSLKTMYLLTYC